MRAHAVIGEIVAQVFYYFCPKYGLVGVCPESILVQCVQDRANVFYVLFRCEAVYE